MRDRMTGVDNFFVPQLPLGEVISGFSVARVLKSRNPPIRKEKWSMARSTGPTGRCGAAPEVIMHSRWRAATPASPRSAPTRGAILDD
jgi:hypothetical protein